MLDNYKKCKICNIDKICTDYLYDGQECYKCVYAKKMMVIPKRAGKVKRLKCKVCHVELPSNRWTYCSNDCLSIAKRQDKHWSLKCKTDSKGWKKRFIFLTRNSNSIRETL